MIFSSILLSAKTFLFSLTVVCVFELQAAATLVSLCFKAVMYPAVRTAALLYTRQKRGGRLDQEYKKRMQTKLNEESFYFLLAIVRYDTINMIYLKKMSEDSNLSRNILIKKAKFRWAFENFFCFLFEEVAADVSVLTFKIRGRKLSKLWIQTYIKLVTLETSLV